MNHQPQFVVIDANDKFVLIKDEHAGHEHEHEHARVTEDPESVIQRLDVQFPGGLKGRRVYCRNDNGDFDQLVHYFGEFTQLSHCSNDQSRFLATFCR